MVGFSKMYFAGMFAMIATTDAGVCPFGHDSDASVVFGDYNIESISGYNSQSAQEKFDYLRHKIDSTPKSAPWPSNFKVLKDLATEKMSVTNDNASDEFPKAGTWGKRAKVIHSRGYIAEAKIEWKSNEYTGLFQGANIGYIRASAAAHPDYTAKTAEAGGFGPGVSIKFLRDGVPSGNLVALNQLQPIDSWNFFKVPLSTHLDVTDLKYPLKFGLDRFSTSPSSWASFIGTSDFARYTEKGDEVGDADIHFPYQLLFYPNTTLQAGPNAFPDVDNKGLDLWEGQLSHLEAGQHLYSIYSKDLGDTPKEHIGDLYMTTTMVPSAYGDQTYFIQHTRFDDDLKLRPEFLNYCAKLEDCPVCHVHGGKDTC